MPIPVWRPVALGGALLAALGAPWPSAARLHAQPRGLPNQCTRLPTGPTPAAERPEGVVILRLREELGAAQRMADQLAPTRAVDVAGERRRLLVLQREIDSVLAALTQGLPPSPEALRRWRPQLTVSMEALERAVRDAEGAAWEPATGATGYLGVGLSGAQLRTLRPDGLWVSHCEYPVVEAVDPGSPAARAGVQAGDTLVALNGTDLRQQAVRYAALLVPGESVVLQLRRGGKARMRTVVVEPRPR